MTVIVARYRVSTPMFLEGPQGGGQRLRVRGASFKGALRFWWRALQYREGFDLDALRSEEADLFGSAATGQSRVSLSIRELSKAQEVSNATDQLGSGAKYLAGQGLLPGKKLATPGRSAIEPGLVFEVTLRVRRGNGDHPSEVDGLLRTLAALGTLGGLGARARRGMGSTTLIDLEADGAAHDSLIARNANALDRVIADFVGEGAASDLPPYTALSRASRFVIVSDDSCARLLEEVGREFVRFRSYGRDGKTVLKEEAERNFQRDHDVAAAMAGGKTVSSLPERIVFGLPHNYFFSKSKKSVEFKPREFQRRASPLFIHLHDTGKGLAYGVVSLLPAVFLPGGREVTYGGRSRLPIEVGRSFWKPAHDFLDRFLGKGTRGEIGPKDLASGREVSLP